MSDDHLKYFHSLIWCQEHCDVSKFHPLFIMHFMNEFQLASICSKFTLNTSFTFWYSIQGTHYT